jgi:hypothetical protein
MTMTDKIRRLIKKGKTAKEIATQLKTEPNRVYTVKWLDAKKVTPEQSSDPDVRKAEKKYIKKISVAYKAKKPSKIIKAVQEMKATLDELDKIKDKPTQQEVKITRKDLLTELQPGLDALFGLEHKKYEAFTPDLVNHPPHYKSGGIETIDFIEAKDLNYRLGNVVKYVSRAGRKNSDPIEDLEKAAWYLQREIAARKNA